MIKKILLVFGTRPEAIKMAPLVIELKKNPDSFKVVVCVTAQHREMLDQVLDLFQIIPDYDLDIMKDGQDLYDVTSRVLLGLRGVLAATKPDIVLVHGDTTTSTAAALAAFYQQVPIGHVEAGLRTNNLYSPWPEEANRQITSRLSTFHFAPTETSQLNLLREGISKDSILITGNTVIDALHLILDKISRSSILEGAILKSLTEIGLSNNLIKSWEAQNHPRKKGKVKVGSRKLILITGHRRENFGTGFINICKAIKQLAEKYNDADFVYPMHLNPNVRKPIAQVFGGDLVNHKFSNNIHFIEPLDYVNFVYLMSRSYLILTDSGGIQEEATGLGKPVLVMRNTTERPEAVDTGIVKLVGTSQETIYCEVSRLVDDLGSYSKMGNASNPYGDGKASLMICEFLK